MVNAVFKCELCGKLFAVPVKWSKAITAKRALQASRVNLHACGIDTVGRGRIVGVMTSEPQEGSDFIYVNNDEEDYHTCR